MADLPTGAEFGVAVHAVLEEVDPQARRPGRRAPPGRAGRAGPAADRRLTAEQLAAALLPAFATPLGPLAGDRTLADIPRPTGWPSWASSCRWPAAR